MTAPIGAIARRVVVGACAIGAGYVSGQAISPADSAAALSDGLPKAVSVSVPKAVSVSVPQPVSVGVPQPTTVSVPLLPTASTPEPPPVPTLPGATTPTSVPPAGGEGQSPSASSAPPISRASAPSSSSAGALQGATSARKLLRGSPSKQRQTPSARGGKRTASAPSGGGAETTSQARTPSAAQGSVRNGHGTGARGGHGGRNPLDTIGRQLPLPLPIPDWSKPIIAVLLLVAAVLGVRLRRAALRTRRLEREDEALLEDVEAMQMALVPDVPSAFEGLAVSTAYHPAEGPAAGGDFYDVFTPSAGKVAIMLGDSCGHGRDALAHAALTRYTLRAYLQAGLQPRAALALAGKVLADPEGLRYATAVLALYESHSGTLTYATAGHPAPIVCGPGMPQLPSTIASPPIGWDTPTGRAQTTLSLPAGTVACFFSDGLTDARRDGELLGHDRLVEALRSLGPRPAATQLLDQLRAQADGTPDDMAACVIAPQVTADVVFTYIQELELDARAAGDVALRSFLEECSLSSVEITKALERARDIASRCDTAQLTVHWTPTRSTVIVTPPEAQTHEVTLLEPEPAGPHPSRLGGRRLGSSTAF